MNYIANCEFCRKVLAASLDMKIFSGWCKDFVRQKFDCIKNTGNSVKSNFYNVISYINIDTKPGKFLTWGPNRFVRI